MIKNEKEKNQDYLDMFSTAYPLPDGIPCYRDKPDVIIEGERKIGIEVTNFYLEEGEKINGELSESEQVQEKARKRVISEAQCMYQKENGKKFRMSFVFSKDNPIQNEKELVEKIISIANDFENYLKTGENRKFISSGFKDTYEAIRDCYNILELFLVSIDFVDTEWIDSTVHSSGFTPIKRLREIIRKKENQLEGYERCDAYWLLVVVDWLNPAQDQELHINGHHGSGAFEKIFIYKTHFGYLEVKQK